MTLFLRNSGCRDVSKRWNVFSLSSKITTTTSFVHIQQPIQRLFMLRHFSSYTKSLINSYYCCNSSFWTKQLQQSIVLVNRKPIQHKIRTYISRAHPKPRIEHALPDAIQLIYNDIEQRTIKRKKRDEYHQKIATTEKPARKVNHPSETLELAIMLNLDPRKPGQSLRGSITLPHGTGKKGQNVIVLSKDEALCEAATKGGAFVAGGESMVDQIVDGTIAIDSINSILATPDIVPILSKKAARILGPRGLMPNAKVGTIHTTSDTLLTSLTSAVAGKEITYRTEKEGIIHVPIGKNTFPISHILDNIGTVMKTIVDVKPESYGKGKKKASGKKGQAVSAKNQPKYILRATMCSTQSRGYRIDLRTIDPGSTFFLTTLDPYQMKSTTATVGTSTTIPTDDTSADTNDHEKKAVSAGQ